MGSYLGRSFEYRSYNTPLNTSSQLCLLFKWQNSGWSAQLAAFRSLCWHEGLLHWTSVCRVRCQSQTWYSEASRMSLQCLLLKLPCEFYMVKSLDVWNTPTTAFWVARRTVNLFKFYPNLKEDFDIFIDFFTKTAGDSKENMNDY